MDWRGKKRIWENIFKGEERGENVEIEWKKLKENVGDVLGKVDRIRREKGRKG